MVTDFIVHERWKCTVCGDLAWPGHGVQCSKTGEWCILDSRRNSGALSATFHSRCEIKCTRMRRTRDRIGPTGIFYPANLRFQNWDVKILHSTYSVRLASMLVEANACIIKLRFVCGRRIHDVCVSVCVLHKPIGFRAVFYQLRRSTASQPHHTIDLMNMHNVFFPSFAVLFCTAFV